MSLALLVLLLLRLMHSAQQLTGATRLRADLVNMSICLCLNNFDSNVEKRNTSMESLWIWKNGNINLCSTIQQMPRARASCEYTPQMDCRLFYINRTCWDMLLRYAIGCVFFFRVLRLHRIDLKIDLRPWIWLAMRDNTREITQIRWIFAWVVQ